MPPRPALLPPRLPTHTQPHTSTLIPVAGGALYIHPLFGLPERGEAARDGGMKKKETEEEEEIKGG